MENKEEVVKVKQILGVALNGDNLVFDDGYTRKVTEEEKSYFVNRNPKAVKLSDGSYEIIRFFDYHRHSEYSLLDGCIRVSDMIKKTKYIGAITDHGNMYCALKWFKGMKKAGKIAVIGEEFYCETFDGDKKGNHLILLAKNNVGYKNLCKLSSMAFKNIYYKPHISYEMLKKYSEGLVCTSACLAGELSQIIMNETGALSEKEINEKLDKCVEAFKSIFGDDYYIEIQNHHIDKEKIVNPMLVSLAKKHNVKVVAATDSHYTNKEDHEIHDVVLCISTGKTIDDETRMKFDGDGYHIYSEDEVEERFSDYPEAIDNTLEIAEKCQYVEIETGKHYLPDFPIPEGFKDDAEYLRYIAQKGFTERFESKFKVLETDDEETKQKKNEQKHKYWSRWKYEMSVIENMGFSGYFLVVWDFLKFCRDNKIPIGAGRGCVNAGTLIYTDRGLVPIEDIKIGDNVYTHDGTLKTVLKTFKYPVFKGEKLNHILCFGGDSFGNAYTDNHKIYALKKESVSSCDDMSVFVPDWIEAKSLNVGDYVVSLFDAENKDFNNSLDTFVSGKYLYKRITEIKYEETDFVYDISVKDNHSYLTSNFIAHNSGAGSLVLYCLHITDFDPIKYDLLFERFLNPDRISLPDIDSDISKRKRDMVIEYVTNKYGPEHVSHIITFGTLAAKYAIKDVARVYNITPSEANAITKTIPTKPGITIGEALGESPEFASIIKKNQLYEKVVKIAQKIEGLPRQTGVHACGICIGQKTIDEYCPTARVKDDEGEYFITTQFEGPEAEDVGLVKFDFLGLRTLDAEDVTLELIKKGNPDFNMSPDDIPINDIESYLMLKEGNTDGVFQFESDGMTSLVKQMFSDVQPTDNEEKGEEYFERLTAAVALYRPGPEFYTGI